MKILLSILLVVTGAFAQHTIPFASQNNLIELSVANSAAIDAGNVTVEITSAPNWLKFTNPKSEINNLKSGESSPSRFSFSVDKSAPVNKPEQVIFTISNSNGERWSKTLSLQVSPPEKFELFQNYPNPFNPSTTISYQLPVSNHVTLKVYDAIGREVATLVDEVKDAGYHEVQFQGKDFVHQNAGALASGMYIYQLAFKNEKGSMEFFRKKMLKVK